MSGSSKDSPSARDGGFPRNVSEGGFCEVDGLGVRDQTQAEQLKTRTPIARVRSGGAPLA